MCQVCVKRASSCGPVAKRPILVFIRGPADCRIWLKPDLEFENPRALQALYANDLRLLKTLEDALKVKVTTREGWVRLEGEPENVEKARQVFQQLDTARKSGVEIRRHEFDYALRSVCEPGQDGNGGNGLGSLVDSKIMVSPAPGADCPEDDRAAQLPPVDRKTRRRLRHRAGGHGEDLPGDGDGRLRAQARAGHPHHPHPARGRGGRGARVPARAT